MSLRLKETFYRNPTGKTNHLVPVENVLTCRLVRSNFPSNWSAPRHRAKITAERHQTRTGKACRWKSGTVPPSTEVVGEL